MPDSPLPPIVTLTLNPALDVSTSVDRVVSRHKLRCDAPRVQAGGGGVNVARVVVALGGDAIPVYAVGGTTGDRYRMLLQQEGLPGIPIPIGGETRESISVVDRADHEQYRFVFPGPTLTNLECGQAVDAAAGLLVPGSWLVMSGSLPPGAPDDIVAHIIRVAHDHGARCAVDVSGTALAQAVAAGVDLVKPSLRELSELIGHELGTAPQQDLALEDLIARSGVGTIALTLGAEGAAIATRDGVERAPAFPVVERSTVGSGDAFLAAYLLRFMQGSSVADALRGALAAGAAVASMEGTGAPHRELVERWEARGGGR